MLSKSRIKFIKSLQVKKYRKQEQCFVVQGAKGVGELLASDFEVVMILGTPEFLRKGSLKTNAEIVEVSERELGDLSEFQSNDTALAVARMKSNHPVLVDGNEFALLLDDIRDPGNLGTIIRTADWFGVTKIIASEETADFYNPKVISATMGSFTRVILYYTALDKYLSESKGNVFGAFLDGDDIHKINYGVGGLILIGNESRGISPSLEPFVTQRITIPRYGQAESLNAAIATAIICDNVRRRHKAQSTKQKA